MECQILPKVPYTQLRNVIEKHNASLLGIIRKNSRSHIILPGIVFPKNRKRKRLAPSDIPGLKEAGWTSEQLISNLHFKINGHWEECTPDSLQQFLRIVLDYIKQLPEAKPFLRPVTIEDAADYFDIIKDPMDLSLMEVKTLVFVAFSSL